MWRTHPGVMLVCAGPPGLALSFGEARLSTTATGDRKSTRLNSSHLGISYAVFCLKKKKNYSINPDIPSHGTSPVPPTQRSRPQAVAMEHYLVRLVSYSVFRALSRFLFFFLMIRRPRKSPLFPSTPLFE